MKQTVYTNWYIFKKVCPSLGYRVDVTHTNFPIVKFPAELHQFAPLCLAKKKKRFLSWKVWISVCANASCAKWMISLCKTQETRFAENKEPLSDALSRTGSNVPLWSGRENILLDLMDGGFARASYVVEYTVGTMCRIWCYSSSPLSNYRPPKGKTAQG